MSKFPKVRANAYTPAWLRNARSLYGAAFEPRKKGELAEAMADWSEMSEEERSFVAVHLQYLGLQAHHATQKLLLELRAAGEAIGDEVIDAVEVALEQAAPLDEPEGEDDQEPGGAHLELVEDDEPEGEPRHMPVQSVAPELLEGAEDEPSLDDYEFEVGEPPQAPEGA